MPDTEPQVASPMTPIPNYPPYTVRALLDTGFVTPATRAALRARLDAIPEAPRFFDAAAYATLRAVCARLIPQPDRGTPTSDPPVDIAAMLDARLAAGTSDGWRYATLPPDPEAHRLGLAGLDQHARVIFGMPFTQLDDARQDATLSAVQRGLARGTAWTTLPAPRFFEELLAEVTAGYYSHPLAQEEIGYVGMADAPGWDRVGLGELVRREPRSLSHASGDARDYHTND